MGDNSIESINDRIIRFDNLISVNKLITNTNLSFTHNGLYYNISWLNYVVEPNLKESMRAGAHRHSFFEIHACLSGEGVYSVQNVEYRVKSGDVILIRSDEPHRFLSQTEDYRKVALGFQVEQDGHKEAEQVRSSLSKSSAVILNDTQDIVASFLDILKEFAAQRINYETMVQLDLIRIITDLIRQCYPINNEQSFEKRVDKRCAMIDRYIMDHIRDIITCNDIAEALHLSTRQVNRIVENEFRVSLYQYVSKVKCRYAKKMLLETKLGLDEICTLLGYANEFSFSKFFKRVEGMSPGQFRRSRYAMKNQGKS